MSDAPELTPVRDMHKFDESKLVAYLERSIDDDFSNLKVLQFEGGQSNPTYHLATDQNEYVLRKKPPGVLLKSAHQVDREYRVMTALADTGVPVPKTYVLCEEEDIVGTAFYVMEYVQGRVFVDPVLPSIEPADRAALYEDFIEVLAKLHSVNIESVGLGDFGRAGNYYARQISRWTKQYRASETERIPEMDSLVQWFPDNIPDADETTLVHGDYRIGNCIAHPTDSKITAVLDWELSTTGHPLADIGYCCMSYHVPREDGSPGLLNDGIPDEEQMLDHYLKSSGRTKVDHWNFYIIYNLFRMGGIVQGVYKRGLDGNASSERWKERANTCRQFAERAWSLVEKR